MHGRRFGHPGGRIPARMMTSRDRCGGRTTEPGAPGTAVDYRRSDEPTSLLEQAMAHRSWCAEEATRAPTRGSSSWVTPCSAWSWPSTPSGTIRELSDGVLSKVRAAVVNTRVLGQLALDLGLPGTCAWAGRGPVRWSDQGVDPGRCHRGGHRGRLSRRRAGRRPTAYVACSASGSTPPWASRASRTTRAGSRSDGPPRPRGAPVRGRGVRARPRPAVPGLGVRWPAGDWDRGRAVEEGC